MKNIDIKDYVDATVKIVLEFGGDDFAYYGVLEETKFDDKYAIINGATRLAEFYDFQVKEIKKLVEV